MINKPKQFYILKKLISGERIGLDGWYAAIPEEGYKGHPFVIKYMQGVKDESGQWHYTYLEQKIPDWNKAVAFRKQPQTLPGRSGFYTLGYFKMEGV